MRRVVVVVVAAAVALAQAQTRTGSTGLKSLKLDRLVF
jgi:hypothetical protein